MKTIDYQQQHDEAIKDVAFSRGEDFESAKSHLNWAKLKLSTVSFNKRVFDWLSVCIGSDAAMDKNERIYRFAEESFELQQACGMTFWESVRLAWYVYRRPVGEIYQEIGGCCTTLTALSHSHGYSIKDAGNDELDRAWDNIEKIRAKHLTKPRRSPLPGNGKQKQIDWHVLNMF